MKFQRLLDARGKRLGSMRVAFVLSAALFVAASSAAAERKTCSEIPYVVKIHADWCGSCKAVASVWKQIEVDLAAQATAVTFDVSDRAAYNVSRETAERLGIGAFFQEYRSRTGTIAVLDCNTREPVVILNAERDFEKYRKAIARAGGAS